MSTINKFLNIICLDERIKDGVFRLDNNDHMDILEEYLVKYGFHGNDAMNLRNKIVEGRFPERQAYNKDGLLVTFPTPDYKKRAINRGTHFEQNPKAAQSNLFQTPQATPAPAPAPTANTATQPETPPPAPSPAPAAPTVPTTAPLDFTPTSEKEPPPPPVAPTEPPKTPQEKQMDAIEVEKMLKT